MKPSIDVDALMTDLEDIEELSDRVRIATYGLASPLLRMRESQMQREIKRVAAKKGKDHPEVAAREASLKRTTERRTLFDEELSRARLDRVQLSGEQGAGVYGRVAEDGKPLSDMTVIAYVHNKRVDFTCTKDNGAFALEVPAESDVVVEVRTADNEVVYRDPVPLVLQPEEHIFLEIDLKRFPEVPCPEPEDEIPEDDKFALVNLVAQTESDARGILIAQGLVLGKRVERPVDKGVGRVLEQDPKAGTMVQRGDVVSIVVGTSNQVTVPNLTGLTPEEAQKVLKESGLTLGKITTVSVRADQAGRVVSQDPVPGGRVPRGDAVAITIGDTSEITVPNLVGRTEKEGKALLEKVGLPLGQVDTKPVSADKAGIIVEQHPAALSRVSPNTAVSIVVGRKDEVTVPNVTGRPEEEGVKILREADLTVGYVTAIPVSEDKEEIIINQNPGAGSQALRGSAVSLEVGRWDEVTVPDLIGRTEDEAHGLLKQAGLKAGARNTTPVPPEQVGRVVRQNPKAGDKTTRGTPVDLVIGTRQLIEVPNVVAKTPAEASEILEKAGLKVGTITKVPVPPAKVGRVINQKPKAGQRVAPGTAIALQIGIRRVSGVRGIATNAEKTLREKGVGDDEKKGLLAKRLKAAGITTSTDLEALVKQKPQVIRDRLQFRNLKITRQTVSALKAALKSG